MKKQNKLDNFQKAILRLQEAVEEYSTHQTNDVLRDGLIQRFEFTYELAWKATKAVLEDLGIVDIRSPKTTFKEAFSQGLIQKETNWLMMLKDRNMTTHVYKEEIADEIAQRIISDYLKCFQDLLNKLQAAK